MMEYNFQDGGPFTKLTCLARPIIHAWSQSKQSATPSIIPSNFSIPRVFPGWALGATKRKKERNPTFSFAEPALDPAGGARQEELQRPVQRERLGAALRPGQRRPPTREVLDSRPVAGESMLCIHMRLLGLKLYPGRFEKWDAFLSVSYIYREEDGIVRGVSLGNWGSVLWNNVNVFFFFL